jgi:hypothetical protein
MGRLTRRVALWGGAAAIAAGGFAFLATNTVEATNAGVGQNTISGYTASTVTYQDVSNANVTPGGFYLQGVVLKLEPANATEVTVWFSKGTGAMTGGYYNCARITPTNLPGLHTYGEFPGTNPATVTTTSWWSCGSGNEGAGVTGGYAITQAATTLHVAATQ